MVRSELATLPVVVVFAGIFLYGSRLSFSSPLGRKAALSAAAGASCAYVFVDLLPELAEASRGFVESTAHRALPFPEFRVYIAALVGFIAFYGLDHLASRSERSGRRRAPEYGGSDPTFLLHIGGFGAYGWVVSYTLVNGPERGPAFVALFAMAMGLHFLTIEHSLVEEHEELYRRPGRQIIAACVLAGWVCGALFELPRPLVLTATGFIGGSVVMNSLIGELPGEQQGGFPPFALGAAGYTLLVLLMSRIPGG